MEKTIESIYQGILDGDQQLVAQQVTDALKAGLSPDVILKDDLGCCEMLFGGVISGSVNLAVIA